MHVWTINHQMDEPASAYSRRWGLEYCNMIIYGRIPCRIPVKSYTSPFSRIVLITISIAIMTLLVSSPMKDLGIVSERYDLVRGNPEVMDPTLAFSSELLLNRNDISFNISKLEDMVADGYAFKMQMNADPPTLPDYSPLTPFPDTSRSDGYVLRSHYHDEMAVVIWETDETDLINRSTYPDLDLDGLSIALTFPVKYSFQDVYVNYGILDEVGIDPGDDNLESFMHGLGYSSQVIRNHKGFIGYQFDRDNYQIMITYSDFGEDKSIGTNSTITMTSWIMDIGEDFIDDIDELFMEYGIPVETVEEIDYSSSTQKMMLPEPDVYADPGSLNLSMAMKIELESLVHASVITGLNESDILSISDNVELGMAGYFNRIIFHNGSWNIFREVVDVTDWGLDNFLTYRFTIEKKNIPLKAFPVGDDIESDRKWIKWTFFGAIISISACLSILFYFKLNRKKLMDNLNRKRLMDLISKEPGIHFKEILRELELKQGVVSHHINVLEKHDMIKSTQDGIYRRFYVYDQKIETKIFLTNIQEIILNVIMDRPGISQSQISKLVGKSKSVIHYNINIMKDAGLLVVEREGRESLCFATSHALS